MLINQRDTAIEEPPRMSYSSLTTYAECGEKWRLTRAYDLDKATWFATVAGSAIHEISEQIDMVSMGYPVEIESFETVFQRNLDKEERNGVEVKPSGKVTKAIGKTGGPNKKDKEWWLIYGPLYVEAWQLWRETSGYTIAEIDGMPAIEIPITVNVGGEPQRGYIDRLMVNAAGEWVIVDLKTGMEPKGILQLGHYRVGLMREYGIDASVGGFWMASTGTIAREVDLTIYTPDYMDSLFEQAWRGIRAGVFLPNITSMCVACSVKESCRAMGGSKSTLYPVRQIVIPRRVEETTPQS